MIAKHTTAADMARTVGVDPNAFREALRSAKYPSRKRQTDWEVQIDSEKYAAMRTVLATLLARNANAHRTPSAGAVASRRTSALA
jgi:hypothetical protein